MCWSHRTHRTSFDMTPTDLEQSSIFKINFTLFSHYCREQNIQRCVFKYVTFNSTSSVLYSLESFWSSTLCFFYSYNKSILHRFGDFKELEYKVSRCIWNIIVIWFGFCYASNTKFNKKWQCLGKLLQTLGYN